MSLLQTFERIASWARSEITPDHVQAVFNVLKTDLTAAQRFVQELQVVHGDLLLQTPATTKPSLN